MTSRAHGFLAIVALLIGGGYYLGFAPFVVLGLVGLTVFALSAGQYLYFRAKIDPQQLHVSREITPGPHRIGDEVTVGLKITSVTQHELSEHSEDLDPQELTAAARPLRRLQHFSTIESLSPALSLRGPGGKPRGTAAPGPSAAPLQVHLGLIAGAGSYRVLPTKRGQWQVGPLALRWQDPAGFFSLTTQHSSYRTVTVWPAVAYLEKLSSTPTAKLQLPDPVSVDVDLRQYQPGDDLRSLHWVSSARRGYPVVRHTKAPGPGNLYLVIDLPGYRPASSADTGEKTATIDTTPSEELLISHACSLALALNDQFQATYVAAQHAFDTESEPATTGEEILNQAALLAPSSDGPEVFSAVLHQLHPLLSPADLVVIAALDSARAAAAIDAFEASSPATTWSALLVPPKPEDPESSLQVLHGNNHTQVKGPLVVKTAEIYALLSGVDRG